MRPILMLLGGVAISAAGLLLVLRTGSDLAGALLIAAGAAVAAIGPRLRLARDR